ncbi:MAG: APC family permease, partial [Legionella sp.]
SAIKVVAVCNTKTKIAILVPSYLGLLGIGVALVVSLTPPPTLQFHSQWLYGLSGALFLALVIAIPLWNQRKALRNYA